MEAKKQINILTFGDSLTEGFHAGGWMFHPYSIELARRIEARVKEVGSEAAVLVRQAGESGEYTNHMIGRLGDILASAAETPYDIVCLLGGTNDLSLDEDESAESIVKRLSTMYDMVLQYDKKNTTLVAITVPESQYTNEIYVGKRTAVNQKIKEYFAHSSHRDRFILVDLEHLLPFRDGRGNTDRVHWDDALHMTPEGYDKFGGAVYEHLVGVIDHLLLGDSN